MVSMCNKHSLCLTQYITSSHDKQLNGDDVKPWPDILFIFDAHTHACSECNTECVIFAKVNITLKLFFSSVNFMNFVKFTSCVLTLIPCLLIVDTYTSLHCRLPVLALNMFSVQLFIILSSAGVSAYCLCLFVPAEYCSKMSYPQ